MVQLEKGGSEVSSTSRDLGDGQWRSHAKSQAVRVKSLGQRECENEGKIAYSQDRIRRVAAEDEERHHDNQEVGIAEGDH